jgi:hypothetical protein
MAEGAHYPKCFDPYLRYAISTDFKNFEFFDEEKGFRLFFLVEFFQAALAKEFVDNLNKALSASYPKLPMPFVYLGPADDSTPYSTMGGRTVAVTAATPGSAVFDLWEKYVSKVELSLPLKPGPIPLEHKELALTKRWQVGKEPPGKLLLGILDDGCPFAAGQFLRAISPASTRVRAIWDQNQDKQPAHINDSAGNPCVFGEQLLDFNYGLEYQRDFAMSTGAPRQMGIDEWISLHLTPAKSIDEDRCYADVPFPSLAFRETHGAHVMDVFAGRIPTSSRIGPTQPNKDRRDPPSWAVGTDPASSVDAVFVQFPESGILDATGVWLKGYVLDGIRYILSFAGPNTEHVIINISYGPTTGPHDGTAALEAGLSALVAYYDGTTNKPKLDIFLAAGNAYLSDGHVSFVGSKGQPDTIRWTWRLLPDNPVLCFSEVWMDSTQAVNVTVSLTPPGGGAPLQIIPIAYGNQNTMWRLEVQPTLIAPGINPAPHGDYTITVSGIGEGAQVDAYVARTDPNLGVISLAKSSCFVDPSWEQTRAAEADCIYVNGEFDNTGSLISRYGTLNGIATESANVSSVHVAGGAMLAIPGRKSPYSSAGPARGHPQPGRVGPDYALYCDDSYALEGVRAGGTRSGVVFRLIGTSAAAPQLARLIADSATLHLDYPTGSLQEEEQRGQGNLEPP